MRVRTDNWDCPTTDAFSNILPTVLLKHYYRVNTAGRGIQTGRVGVVERLRRV